ncbi:hypothetical protein QZH41_014153 [Actinostola sp. cb2023]|nr:hypothetical protein QZH41_014153 [Actinostola sp. cb2023]
MSLEDVFGSDLEDSDNEEYKASSKQAEINDLFGESASEEEDDKQATSKHESDAEDDEQNGSIVNREDEEIEEKVAALEELEDEAEGTPEGTPVPDTLTHANLFGDELSSDEEKENQREVHVPSPQQRERIIEGGEEEEEETRIDVTIPYCRVPLGSELYFSKLPNFLSVETKPFDQALYEDDVEDDEILDEEGRARLKLKVENTIRWRYRKDSEGNEIKESNARVVRWSDGSSSLLVGQEVFDIQKTQVEGNFNHLFVQQKEDEKLRAQLRLDNQQRRMRERSQAKGLSASYLEGDEEDEELEESLLKIKKKYKQQLAKGHSYSSDGGEESFDVGGLESDEEGVGEERLINAKKGIDAEGNNKVTPSRKRTNSEGSIRKREKEN